MKYLPPARPKMFPILKLLRIHRNFCTYNISSMPIFIFMSKIIFIKYLPPVRPKLVPELKMPGIH